eukprot:6492775-Amphidinium_carterae.1
MPFNHQLWVSCLDKSKEYFKNQMDMAPAAPKAGRDTHVHVHSELAQIKPARSKACAWEVHLHNKPLLRE